MGIVAGTLGVARYRDAIARLRAVAALAGKKTYVPASNGLVAR